MMGKQTGQIQMVIFELDVKYADFEYLQRPGSMKKNAKVKIRIVYETGAHRIVGAQMASAEDISMRIHMFSLAIEEVTIDKLKLLELFSFPILISFITTSQWRLYLQNKVYRLYINYEKNEDRGNLSTRCRELPPDKMLLYRNQLH